MQRCLHLAAIGQQWVAPNPMVGAVVVKNDKIIGEGYHKKIGGPHAEVNAIDSVENKSSLNGATLYVSLEPCVHFGKTPPCTNLIIEHHISKVVVACLDPNPLVAGKGVNQLKNAGIEVIVGVLEQEAKRRKSLHYPFESVKRELKHRRKECSAKIRKPMQSVNIDEFAKSLGQNPHGLEKSSKKTGDKILPDSLSFAHIADDLAILQHTAKRIDQRLDEFLLLASQALPTTHPEELHQLRIAAKRLRYLLELASEFHFF